MPGNDTKPLATIRTDVIGSLLRPQSLKQSHLRYDEGQLDAEELRKLEDDAIRHAVKLQEDVGLDVVTDGEYRRLNFQDSFAASVTGFDTRPVTIGFIESLSRGGVPLRRWDAAYELTDGAAILQRRPVTQKLRLVRHLPLEEYRFVSRVADKPAKVTLIGPDRITQRFDYHNSKTVYWSVEDFVADVIRIEREMIRALSDAGCPYVQIDAPGYTAYIDEPALAAMRKRGENPMKNLAASISADNELLRLFPDLTFGIHLCRGNQRSMWHHEGSYDIIAEMLFSELRHDRFLLEYDSPRAGTFEPLRFVPKGKVVVLGLVSTKVPEIEKVDDLKRRIEEASRYVSLDQLAISPQCGFASDVVGNLISEDEQRKKLAVVVETARQVWGKRAS